MPSSAAHVLLPTFAVQAVSLVSGVSAEGRRVAVLRAGLTGGIGSGKSEVSRRLAAQGVVAIDADVAPREVVTPGPAGLA
jgi:polynucleotide 5'-kinase involved in rRNA processing